MPQNSTIPSVIEINEGQIPESVASVPVRKEPEITRLQISFKEYNEDQCQIKDLEDNKTSKKCLKQLKVMGMSTVENLLANLKLNGDVSPVYPQHGYIPLFSKLTEDVEELSETKIGDSARIFFYYDNATVYIVAIRQSHYETKKR